MRVVLVKQPSISCKSETRELGMATARSLMIAFSRLVL